MESCFLTLAPWSARRMAEVPGVTWARALLQLHALNGSLSVKSWKPAGVGTDNWKLKD